MCCFRNYFFLGIQSQHHESRMIMSLQTQATCPRKMYPQPCSRLVAGFTDRCTQLKISTMTLELTLPSALLRPSSQHLYSVAFGIQNISWCKFQLTVSCLPKLSKQSLKIPITGGFLVLWVHNYISLRQLSLSHFPHKPCYFQKTVLQITACFKNPSIMLNRSTCTCYPLQRDLLVSDIGVI